MGEFRLRIIGKHGKFGNEYWHEQLYGCCKCPKQKWDLASHDESIISERDRKFWHSDLEVVS